MTPQNASYIENFLDMVQQKITAHQPDSYQILLHRNDYRHEGDWWYIVVHPSDNNIRASEYTRTLEQIEDEIAKEDGVNVLFVPTIED